MAGTHDAPLGRGTEFAAVGRALDAAADGEGSTLVLAGPAGIGKTFLTQAATRLAGARDFTCLRARGNVGEATIAFGAVRQLLERSLHDDKDGALLAGSARLALPVLEPGAADPGVDGAVPSDPYAALHGLFWLCSNLSERGPLLLVVDDLHWVDPASVRFLSYLAHRIGDLPVVLLLGLRTGEPIDRTLFDPLLTNAQADVVDVAPLDLLDAATLVRRECGEAAADGFCRACHAATGGNPFLLRELLRSIVEDGIEPTEGSAGRVAAVTPAAVMRTVTARLDRLPADADALARSIAVVGPQTELQLAARIAGLDLDAAAEAADLLTAAGILTGTSRLEFVHPLIRTAIYEQLSPGDRVGAHSIAADAPVAASSAGEQRARHLLHVPPAGDPERVRVLLAAGRDAAARGVPESTVSYLQRALEEPPAYAERGTVLFELGRAEAMLAAHESLDHLAEALELTPAVDGKIAILRETAYTMVANFGLFAEAFEVFGATRDMVGTDDPDLALLLYAEEQTWGSMHHDPPMGERLLEVERGAAGLTGATTGERAVLAVLTFLRATQGRPISSVREAGAAALADGRLTATLGTASLTSGLACTTLAYTLSPVELEPLLGVHMHQARAGGSRHGIGVHTHAAGALALRSGRLRDAEALLREGMDALLEVNSVGSLTWVLADYLDVLRERGETAAAWRELENLGLGGDLPPLHAFALMHLSRGRLSAARGDLDAALADFMKVADLLRRWGAVSPAFGAWRSAAAEIHRVRGDTDRAAELLREELDLARGAELTDAEGRALRLLARCEDEPRQIELLREAVETLAPSYARLEHAYALVDLGASLRRANRRGTSRPDLDEARETLRLGLDVAQQCGATPLAEFAHTELRATGARPRSLVLSGPDSLTASERRVSQLAVEGMSNREIAEALFVSLKTVEKHLGNSYGKLGIASRTELGHALAGQAAS